MSVRHILRIRPDHTVVLQPAITTDTAGIYLAHVVVGAGPTAMSRWQLRLECGYALGERTYSLSEAHHLAARLGTAPLNWANDYQRLCRDVHAIAGLDAHLRSELSRTPAVGAA